MRTNRRAAAVAATVFLVAVHALLSAQPQSPKAMSSAEIAVALKKLTVLGSALYIGAHPDDENTSALACLAKGRGIRAAYLTITRGEGGQNLLGPEQGKLMGIIRTQELLAARRIDGAEQFFTRAIDFGYSKNSDETLQMWGKEKTLADVVWIIRKFRPDVVLSRFTPKLGGHGNHTASAILTEEAYRAAGDSTRFPEQLQYVSVWQPRRLVWNVFRFQQNEQVPPGVVSLDVGTYNPLLGKSFTEIAGISRSMHKSQGFGAAENRGAYLNYFQHIAGDSAKDDLFDGVDPTWFRVKGGDAVGRILEEAYRRFIPNDPAAILPLLLQAYSGLQNVADPYWVEVKRKELLEVIKSCAGLWIDALAAEYSASPGSDVRLTVAMLNRSSFPIVVRGISLPFDQKDTTLNSELVYNKSTQAGFILHIPESFPYTQPYWLRATPGIGSYAVRDQEQIGKPENDPPFVVKVSLAFGDVPLDLEIPVRYRWTDPVEGELYKPFEVVPPVAPNLRQLVSVFSDLKSRKLEVALRSGAVSASGSVHLDVPAGWSVTPSNVEFEIKGKNEEQVVTFEVAPENGAVSGIVCAVVETNGRTITEGIRTIEYKHIPPQTLFPPAEGRLIRMNLLKKGNNIAYIMGAGDEIPTALRQVGYEVTLLSDEELAQGDLSRYDAIIAGVRAYNTRPRLRLCQKRLLDYVERGGTYVVQYVTVQRGESENLGPYPFSVSRDRVTVEGAPVKFVNPEYRILNFPNKITQDDFQGWVQERGLYFADKWDAKFATVIACNDPDEQPKEGGLLVAQYGKGYYVYTGYAFFRQLPAGVAGAYRLFVNLISIGR